MLAAILGKDRSWLLAHPECQLSADEETRWRQWENRRRGGEPVAYITGTKEFYGRMFDVTPATLIPRPATEGLIDLAREALRQDDGWKKISELDHEIIGIAKRWGSGDITTLVDIGTGSGCIAVTLALECPDKMIIATDISSDALEISQRNAARHHVRDRIDFRHGSALDPLTELAEPFFIVSNPPYIPEHTLLETDVVDHEPHAALFGGADGADIIRTIVRQATAHPMCRGYAIECQADQRGFFSA